MVWGFRAAVVAVGLALAPAGAGAAASPQSSREGALTVRAILARRGSLPPLVPIAPTFQRKRPAPAGSSTPAVPGHGPAANQVVPGTVATFTAADGVEAVIVLVLLAGLGLALGRLGRDAWATANDPQIDQSSPDAGPRRSGPA